MCILCHSESPCGWAEKVQRRIHGKTGCNHFCTTILLRTLQSSPCVISKQEERNKDAWRRGKSLSIFFQALLALLFLWASKTWESWHKRSKGLEENPGFPCLLYYYYTASVLSFSPPPPNIPFLSLFFPVCLWWWWWC